MFTLPDVPGRYPVGATTFAVPIDVANPEDRIFGEARLNASSSSGGHTNGPALKLEEVAFTAFYPAKIRDSKGKNLSSGLSWLPRPLGGMLRGYAHFSKWSFWLVHLLFSIPARVIKIPVYANAPLLDPAEDNEFIGQSWPLVFFSHGLAGNRTNYSHICSRLASQGKVVLAFEHRDGTGPYVETRSSVPGRYAEGSPDHTIYLHPEDVSWGDKADMPKYPLRQQQLRFRQVEVYLAYTRFKKFVAGSLGADTDEVPHSELHTVDGPWTFNLNSRQTDRDFWASWMKTGSRLKVECDEDICLMGHSFGGATVLYVLSTEPPTFAGQNFPQIPCTHAIALDPWIDPLPLPGPTPLAIERSLQGERVRGPPKLLVINSEGFTLWDEHFQRLEEIVRTWNEKPESANDATLLTIVRCQHISFSDFGVLVPFGQMARDGRKFLDVTCDLASAFVDGRFKEVFDKQRKVVGEVEQVNIHKPDSNTEWKKRFVGEVGDIIMH